MKRSLFGAIFLAGSLSLFGRTWTSADGSKEMVGELKSFDADSNQVTLLVEEQEVVFSLEKLSEADQAFVREQENEGEERDMGKLLSQASLHKVVEGKYETANWEQEAEYYLLYFSASW
ncbi:hypothetical protein [Roseibacillus ishigakijimensis]|uniref:SLA1 homology domain-containing protein n=1 Tax=Roseibacillus ishigakijimensis TaxID=454146 RepID=A0A934VNV2_9BACT|nr:hypothetical protein [Roseibacillus ishigakijimensis]